MLRVTHTKALFGPYLGVGFGWVGVVLGSMIVVEAVQTSGPWGFRSFVVKCSGPTAGIHIRHTDPIQLGAWS